MAPNIGTSSAVWYGPGPSCSAGSSENRNGFFSPDLSYSNDAFSLPPRARPQAPDQMRSAIKVNLGEDCFFHHSPSDFVRLFRMRCGRCSSSIRSPTLSVPGSASCATRSTMPSTKSTVT
jgi:hypothetical protein